MTLLVASAWLPPVGPDEPDDPPAAELLLVLVAAPPAPPAPPLPDPAVLLLLLTPVADEVPPFVVEWAAESPPNTEPTDEPTDAGGCGIEPGIIASALDCARSQQPAAPTATAAILIFQLDMVNRNSALDC